MPRHPLPSPPSVTPDTPPDPVYMIQCAVSPIDEGRCDGFEIQFQVSGAVSGGDLEGVLLEIEYSNEQAFGDLDVVITVTTPILADNTFSLEFEANPVDGEWADSAGNS